MHTTVLHCHVLLFVPSWQQRPDTQTLIYLHRALTKAFKCHTHTLTHTHTHTLPLTHTDPDYLPAYPHTHTLSLSHTDPDHLTSIPTHTHTLSLSHTQTHIRSLTNV